MRCRAARRAIDLRLDERLSLEQGFVLDRHLETCEACLQVWENALEIEEGLLRIPEAPMAQLRLDDCVTRIQERLALSKETTVPKPTQVSAKLWATALTSAAGLVLWGTLSTESRAPESSSSSAQHVATEQAIEPDRLAALGQPETIPVPVLDTPMDDQRMAQARAEVREHLQQAYKQWQAATSSPEDSSEGFAKDVDQRTQALRRQSWPVLRISEGLLEDQENGVASAAARYLGLRGNRGSIRRLEKALQDESLLAPVILALNDAGVDGVDALSQALMIPAQRERVATLLIEHPTARAAQAVADLIEAQASAQGHANDPELLEILVAMGSRSLPVLFDLGQAKTLSFEQLCAVLKDIPSAGSYLVSALSDSSPKQQFENNKMRLQVRCAGIFAAQTAGRWLRDHIHERPWQSFCLEQLPHLEGTPGVEALVRLDDDPRMSSSELDGLYEQALAFDTGRFIATLTHWEQLFNPNDHEVLARRMLSLGTRPALPVVRALVEPSELSDDLRQDLILFLARHGEEQDAALAAAVLSSCSADQGQLASAALLLMHRWGSEERLMSALKGTSQRQQSNILDLLRRHKAEPRTTPSLYKLARELRPWLHSRAQTTRSSSS